MKHLKKLSAVISFILMVSLFGCDGTSSSVVEYECSYYTEGLINND